MSMTLTAPPSGIGIIGRVIGLLTRFQEAREQRLLRRAEATIERFNRAVGYARVSAEALERERPGSLAKLNLLTLHIANPRKCALAQIYGHYDDAPAKLRDSEVGNGFRIPLTVTTADMNAAWRVVVEEYREQTV
jgi:hypothetical protein